MAVETTLIQLNSRRLFSFLYRYGIYVVLGIMIIFFSTTNPNFLTLKNAMIILQQAAPLGIAAIGMTFVLVVAGIDISVGQNMYLSAILVGIAMEAMKPSGFLGTFWSYAIIYTIALLVGGAVGALNGLVISRFKFVPFIASLATMGIARGSRSHLFQFESLLRGKAESHLQRWDRGHPLRRHDPCRAGNPFSVCPSPHAFRPAPHGHRQRPDRRTEGGNQRGGSHLLRLPHLWRACRLAPGLSPRARWAMSPCSLRTGTSSWSSRRRCWAARAFLGGKGVSSPAHCIGIILVTTIVNGMTMMNASPYAYKIVRGGIIFVAVMVDSLNYKGELR